MKTLAVISHKGGAGKTSSAVMIAEDLARRGMRIVLIDADRQRGAGLLLGLDQPSANVLQTRDPRLRYFCSSGLPLRELPSKAEELSGLFDIAVIDTPSLDDPLAKGWIQLATEALFVMPVEPLSVRTIEGADVSLDGIRRLNPQIRVIGTLPTIFEEKDPVQRTLMLELRAQRGDELLAPAIPYDQGMAHRAAQQVAKRTEASDETRAAYHAVCDLLVKELQPDGFGGVEPIAPSTWGRGPVKRTPAPRPRTRPAREPAAAAVAAAPAPAAASAMPTRGYPLKWILATLAVIALIAVVFVLVNQTLAAKRDAVKKEPAAATRTASRGAAPGAKKEVPKK